ncbi:tRNA (adenine(22)-N(1))-methyltransferase [Mycoplasma sp. HU2014]|uniref:tRNA (adenine(22)-N(1))-methyltransferase n=1 Tax=Mycoplasma sp. HU2014 TaxID=1664275 RepID=UPI00067E4449|nr:class I SAM-dependent methyltransferase [Mycoplasma sp. HU2014]KNG79257.1 tRNA (adenine(22)-N(1))-methyltransferase [Mycoplasma sp. HU2014]
MISKRLKSVSLLIDNANVVADIGTDHAYLPIYLVKNKKAKKVYACDLNKKPLQSAKENISKFGFNSQIFTILSNGLEFVLDPLIDDIDIVTICGLGSQTILDVLSKDHKKISKYIICSNTQISQIRKWTVDKDFKISYEQFVVEDNHCYWIAVIDKNLKSNLKDEQYIRFGDKSFFINDQQYISFLKNEVNNLKRILKQIDISNPRNQEIQTQIDQIGEYINVIS